MQKNNGNLEPEFIDSEGRFIVSIVSSNNRESVSVDEVPNPAVLSDMVDVQMIRKYPYTTAKQMSESLDITVRTIRRHISSLTERGYISREGTTRGGRFFISYDVVNDVLEGD